MSQIKLVRKKVNPAVVNDEFRAFFLQHSDLVWRELRILAPRMKDVRSMLRGVFVAAFVRRELIPPGSEEAWLRNACRVHVRIHQRMRRHARELWGPEAARGGSAVIGESEEAAAKDAPPEEETAEAIQQAALRLWEEMSPTLAERERLVRDKR